MGRWLQKLANSGSFYEFENHETPGVAAQRYGSTAVIGGIAGAAGGAALNTYVDRLSRKYNGVSRPPRIEDDVNVLGRGREIALEQEGNKFLRSHGGASPDTNIQVRMGELDRLQRYQTDKRGRTTGGTVILSPRTTPAGVTDISKPIMWHEFGHATQPIGRLGNKAISFSRANKGLAFGGLGGAGVALAASSNDPYVQGAGAAMAVAGLAPHAYNNFLEADAWRRGAKMYKPSLESAGKTFNRGRYWKTAFLPMASYAAKPLAALAGGSAVGYGLTGLNSYRYQANKETE